MKRQLEEDYVKNKNKNKDNDNINNIQKIDVNHEIQSLEDIFENDEIEIIINVFLKEKQIKIVEKRNEKDNIRKYKYVDKGLKSLIDSIDDEFMYKTIKSFTLKVNNNNIFADIYKWKEQLLNELSYIEILEKEKQNEDELVELLESTLIL